MHTILNEHDRHVKVSDLQFDDLILSAQYNKSYSTVKINGEFHRIPLTQFAI